MAKIEIESNAMTNIIYDIENDILTIDEIEATVEQTEINNGAGFFSIGVFIEQREIDKLKTALEEETIISVVSENFPEKTAKITSVKSEDRHEGYITYVRIRLIRDRILHAVRV